MSVLRPPLLPADYQRLVRVLKAVHDGAASTINTSIFFSVAGAHLIEQVYGKRCQPVAGAAFFKLDDDVQSVLSFPDKNSGRQDDSGAGDFHCSMLCEAYIVDLMAPLFPEAMRAAGIPGRCSRKMFQKPREAMVDSPLLMQEPGDFYMLPNVDRTRTVVREFFDRPDANDLLEICAHWYRKPPLKIDQELAVAASDGSVTQMKLGNLALTGVW